MKNTTDDLKNLGLRLGLVVAKYPNGRKEAEDIAGISPSTLNRWLAGKLPKIPLLPLAQICKKQNVSMDWLLYGDKYLIEPQIKIDIATEWGAKVREWMEQPGTCDRDYFFTSEIIELVLGIKKDSQMNTNHRIMALALKGQGWEIKKISTDTPARYRCAFYPPSWTKEKETYNDNQHDWVEDINAS